MELWQRIIVYAFILIALFIFVKTSQIEINGIKIIKLRYRVLLALFFPVILILIFLFSSILISLILTILFIILLVSLLFKLNKKLYKTKRKYKI